MQSIISITQVQTAARGERLALTPSVAERLACRVFGCWRHRLGRPFTRDRRAYRVCVKCGMYREFDVQTWKTYGPFRLPGAWQEHPRLVQVERGADEGCAVVRVKSRRG